MKNLVFIAFGALFGFFLSRARATDFDAIAGMFQLTDLHLFGVIGVAIVSAAAGLFVARRARLVPAMQPKAMHPLVFVGGLVFGVGWAITGACPGTALTQIGEGKLYALATAAGVLAGTFAFVRLARPRTLRAAG